MIPMTMIGKVRRMHHRQNKSVCEISRLTSLSRNTIHTYLNADVQEEPKYRRKAKPTRLTPFHEALTQALAMDARRPKKERRTGWMLFREIQAASYKCYSRVTISSAPGGTARARRWRTRYSPPYASISCLRSVKGPLRQASPAEAVQARAQKFLRRTKHATREASHKRGGSNAKCAIRLDALRARPR